MQDCEKPIPLHRSLKNGELMGRHFSMTPGR